MRSRRPRFTLVLLVFALASFPAHAQNGQQPPVTPGDPRAVYVVVLNHEKGAEPEFDKGGAKQLARWSNRVVVELPPAALAAMLKHGRVKYVQHLNNGPVKATAPSPERTSASFVPKALTGGGTLNWTTGDYHYDGSGNIDRVGADSSGNTRRFVYDEVDRLVEAGVEAPMAAPGTYTNYSRYTYDSFGNRLSEQTPTINATVVADKNTNRITLPGTIMTYDGVGNMTQGGGLIYQYDPFNNLKEVDSWGGVQKMSIYNAANERIIFCGDGSSGPCRWTLRGNGNEVLREYESGPIGNGNSFWSYYLWVEDSVYRGPLLAGAQREAAEGGRLDFHLDHLGSPRLTTNAAGQQVTANEFAPFGRELTSITQETQLGYDRTETHRFTGHERDFVEGTGSDTVNVIDYMHARTYQPTFGRFLSVDPVIDVKTAMTSPQAWNRYAYVRNNPTRWTDPSGKVIAYDDEFRKRVRDDEVFRMAFEAWKKTKSGAAQWQKMAGDKDTKYTLGVAKLVYQPSLLSDKTQVNGMTLPAAYGARQNKYGQLNNPEVSARVNPDRMEEAGSKNSQARTIAGALFEEVAHALDLGSSSRTEWGAYRAEEGFHSEPKTEPRWNRFQEELSKILPPEQ